jgi:hypothetical protein
MHDSIGATYLNCVNSVQVLENPKENLSNYIKLGGTISVESNGKTGTTFYMKFPF